ncbi:MAG: hypothetical protein ABEI52_02435 [Halobacteriaceae archaeon]
MTADRWWVRLAARWMARVDGVSGQLRLAMLGLTGISTATLTLKQYGHSEFAWPLILVIGLGTIVYTYYYTEGGVWNQVNRDRVDLSDNYAGPTMRIDDELQARAVMAGLKGEALSEAEREAIQDELDQAFNEYRRGIDLDDTE